MEHAELRACSYGTGVLALPLACAVPTLRARI